MWRHSVSTWRHEVTELTIHILACRCARKMILFLFPWYFGSLSSNMLLISHLVCCRDVMTSCHDVTKADLPISACRYAVIDFLILFLFPWFFRSLSSKMLLIFHVCDVVTSWRHVMTSQNLIHVSQLVDVLERWFFFCFHGFLCQWVQKCYWFFHLCDVRGIWRHVMTSQRLFHLTQVVDLLERWSFSWFHGFSGCLFWKCYCSCNCGMISCHNVTSWRHVNT